MCIKFRFSAGSLQADFILLNTDLQSGVQRPVMRWLSLFMLTQQQMNFNKRKCNTYRGPADARYTIILKNIYLANIYYKAKWPKQKIMQNIVQVMLMYSTCR